MLRAKQDLVELISHVRSVDYIKKGTNRVKVTQEQKSHFCENEADYAEYRKDVERELNSRFKFVSIWHGFRRVTNLLDHQRQQGASRGEAIFNR